MLKTRNQKKALRRYYQRQNLMIIDLNKQQLMIFQRLLNKHLENIDNAINEVEKFSLPTQEFKNTKDKVKKLWINEKTYTRQMLEKVKESKDGKNKNRVYQSNRFR